MNKKAEEYKQKCLTDKNTPFCLKEYNKLIQEDQLNELQELNKKSSS